MKSVIAMSMFFKKITKIVQFSTYFLKKRFSVFLGFHKTPNPLSLRWRWHHWVDTYYDKPKKQKRKLS